MKRNRSSPSNVSISTSSSSPEHVCSVWEHGLQFTVSLWSKRSEVSRCTQRSPKQLARSVSCLCFRVSVVFDALRESVLNYLDVNAVGYRVKGERFAHDERDVRSSHVYVEMSNTNMPSWLKVPGLPGTRFSLLVQTNVTLGLQNPGWAISHLNPRKLQEFLSEQMHSADFQKKKKKKGGQEEITSFKTVLSKIFWHSPHQHLICWGFQEMSFLYQRLSLIKQNIPTEIQWSKQTFGPVYV